MIGKTDIGLWGAVFAGTVMMIVLSWTVLHFADPFGDKSHNKEISNLNIINLTQQYV